MNYWLVGGKCCREIAKTPVVVLTEVTRQNVSRLGSSLGDLNFSTFVENFTGLSFLLVSLYE